MVPNVATGGHSFNGALRYYLHDKGAQTQDRLAWTATRNLGTDNVDTARRVMIATANRADDLKKAAGVAATGRKGTSVLLVPPARRRRPVRLLPPLPRRAAARCVLDFHVRHSP